MIWHLHYSLIVRAMPECPALVNGHCFTSHIAGRTAGVGLKNLVKYFLCVAEHLLLSTVKRHHCGIWLKTI